MDKRTPYRAVYCQIWSDDKFPFCSDDAKLVFFHAYTNEFTNALGIYKASVEALAADIRWPVERYHKGLGECLGKRFVKVDLTSHIIYFPNYLRWNRPANPNVFDSWLNSWDYIPPSQLKVEFYQELIKFAERWGEGYAKRLGKHLGKRFANVTPNSDSDSDSN